MILVLVVHDIKDRKFWKQITTVETLRWSWCWLFTTSKIENFESKSQRPIPTILFASGCSRHQRSKILKANHNILAFWTFVLALFTTSKIENFESKSQLQRILLASVDVVHDIKDRKFWKQITTHNSSFRKLGVLFTTSKIENFESKSQQMLVKNKLATVVHDIKDRKFWKQITTTTYSAGIRWCCSRHQRSKILKANHNQDDYHQAINKVVHDIKDRKFWKQITTVTKVLLTFQVLFTTSKIENFESKSQPMKNKLQPFHSCSRHQRSKILKANRN